MCAVRAGRPGELNARPRKRVIPDPNAFQRCSSRLGASQTGFRAPSTRLRTLPGP